MKIKFIIVFTLFSLFVSSQTNYSYFQTSNIPKSPFGASFFVHKKHLGYYFGFNVSGFSVYEDLVKHWSPYSTLYDVSGYSWLTDYGSYEYYIGTSKIRYGTASKYYVFNLGLSKDLLEVNNLTIKLFLGGGFCRVKRKTISEKKTTAFKNLHLELADYNDSSFDEIITYDYITTEKLNKFNINSGLLFEWLGGASLGIGFDTKAMGVNLMAGLNWKIQLWAENKAM